MNKLNKKTVWTTSLNEKLYIEIVHWGVERAGFEAMNEGKGCWNYYILIPERIVGTEIFEKELWLDDKLIKFTKDSPERVTHDYYKHRFSDVNWHGGVTFYEKIGQLKGHRMVKIGCDYSHLWDMERGYGYTIEEVYREALQTATELADIYLPKQEIKSGAL